MTDEELIAEGERLARRLSATMTLTAIHFAVVLFLLIITIAFTPAWALAALQALFIVGLLWSLQRTATMRRQLLDATAVFKADLIGPDNAP